MPRDRGDSLMPMRAFRSEILDDTIITKILTKWWLDDYHDYRIWWWWSIMNDEVMNDSHWRMMWWCMMTIDDVAWCCMMLHDNYWWWRWLALPVSLDTNLVEILATPIPSSPYCFRTPISTLNSASRRLNRIMSLLWPQADTKVGSRQHEFSNELRVKSCC